MRLSATVEAGNCILFFLFADTYEKGSYFLANFRATQVRLPCWVYKFFYLQIRHPPLTLIVIKIECLNVKNCFLSLLF